jgi:hypothetical protein
MDKIRENFRDLRGRACYYLKQRQTTGFLWQFIHLKNQLYSQCCWTQEYETHQMKSSFPKIIYFVWDKTIVTAYCMHLFLVPIKMHSCFKITDVNVIMWGYHWQTVVLKYNRFTTEPKSISFSFKNRELLYKIYVLIISCFLHNVKVVKYWK